MRALDSFGGDSGGGTPLPIPNREVKPARADGTRRATSRESRSPPIILEKEPRLRLFFVLGRGLVLHPVAPGGIELAEPAHPFLDRWVRVEQPGRPVVCERVDREQRLRRGTAFELDELRSLLQARQGVREAMRGVAER